MKAIAFAVGLMLLFFAIPVQAQTMTAAQKADIEKAVKAKVTQLYGIWDSMNAEAYVQLWSRDKIIGELSATGLQTNFETMLNNFKTNFANQTSRKNNILDIRVDVLSPEMALAFSKSGLRIETKSGNIANYNYADITIWVKESGEWKLAHWAYASATKQ
jgi:ketosteroid isomerase-like protein